MPLLDDMPEGTNAVHLLGIADSKAGKSVYAAQAAIDGFNMIYIDGDNGRSALDFALMNNREAKRRVHYFPVSRIVDFTKGFLRSTTAAPLRWNRRTNKVWSHLATGCEDDDEIWIIDSSKIPASWLLTLDSWTAVANDALGIGDATQAAELLEGTNQGIYGEAFSNCQYLCNLLQKVPYHVFVQAHGTRFEVWDKPKGAGGGVKIQQKDMTLRETKDVPVSCSRPHGESMVSRFNHIGWFYVNNLGIAEIDFTRRPDRVGGGPPNTRADVNKLPFTKLVGTVPANEPADGFVEYATHGELIEKHKAAQAAKAQTSGGLSKTPAATTPPAPATAAPAKAATPTPVPSKPLLNAGALNLNLKK